MQYLNKRSIYSVRIAGGAAVGFLCLALLSGCTMLTNLMGLGKTEEKAESSDSVLLSMLNPNSDLDKDGILNGDDPDIDGDGLDNESELTYGTSPYIADTDGDGWNDYEEVELYVASVNKFNPLTADMPRIQLVLKSEPQVKLAYTTSAGADVSYETSKTTGYESSHTTSNSYTSTTSSEYGWSVEAGVEYKFGTSESGLTLSGKVGATGSYTNEDSHEWGSEVSETNSYEAQTAYTESSSSDLTKTGGSIKYAVAFKNNGPIAYTVDSMLLSSYRVNSSSSGLVDLIGSLSQDSDSGFSSFTLAPGEESGTFTFQNANLNVSDVLSLLQDSSGIVCAVSGYTVSMEGNTFTQSATQVAAKTAKLVIDYGPGETTASEQYLIATKRNVNEAATGLSDLYEPVTLREALKMANVAFETEGGDGFDGLSSVRDIKASSTSKKHWYVTHQYTANGTTNLVTYADNSQGFSYLIDDIKIRTGDMVQLIYSVDVDGDGVPLRVEKLLGTSDSSTDSDGDGLGDYKELNELKTNPANADTDGDTIRDNVDADPLTPLLSKDATLSSLSVNGGKLSFTPTFASDTTSYSAASILSDDTITISPAASSGAHEISISVNGGTPVTVKTGYTSSAIALPLGTDTVSIVVTALDCVTTKTYTLNLSSALAVVPNVRVSATGAATTSLAWDSPGDSRVSGYLVLRASSSATLAGLSPSNVGYSAGNTIGSATIISVPGSGALSGTDASLSEYSTYYYGVMPYNLNGSTYTYGSAASLKVASCTTAKSASGSLSTLLYFLMADSDNDGTTNPSYYWTVTASVDGGASTTLSSQASHGLEFRASTGAGIKYYMFADGARSDTDTGTAKATDLGSLSRSSNHTLQIYLVIWDYDASSSDDLISSCTYNYNYSASSDTWSGGSLGANVGYHSQRADSTHQYSSDGGTYLKLGLKWW